MATATAPCPRWYWQDETREWIAHDEDSNNMLEVASQAACSECLIMGGKYRCDLANRVQQSLEQNSSVFRIIRATWFWQNSRYKWLPYPEDTAEILENGYYKQIFNVKISLNLENVYVILEGVEGLGRQYIYGNDSFYQNIRRGYNGQTVPRADFQNQTDECTQSNLQSPDSNLAMPAPNDAGAWREGLVLAKNEFGNFKKTRHLVLYSEFLNVLNKKRKSIDRIVLRAITDVIGPRMLRNMYQFQIVTIHKTYVFVCSSSKDVELWVEAIRWVKNNASQSMENASSSRASDTLSKNSVNKDSNDQKSFIGTDTSNQQVSRNPISSDLYSNTKVFDPNYLPNRMEYGGDPGFHMSNSTNYLQPNSNQGIYRNSSSYLPISSDFNNYMPPSYMQQQLMPSVQLFNPDVNQRQQLLQQPHQSQQMYYQPMQNYSNMNFQLPQGPQQSQLPMPNNQFSQLPNQQYNNFNSNAGRS